jgi:hypothetical protein
VFADESRPTFFDTDGLDLTLRYQYEPIPTNDLTIEYQFGRTNQDRNQFCASGSPNEFQSCESDSDCGLGGLCVIAEDYDENALLIAWAGNQEHRWTYRLKGGYKVMDFEKSQDVDFSGLVGDLNLRYSFSRTMELRGRVTQEAFPSFFENYNFFESNLVEAIFNREVTQRVSWEIRGSYRWNRYPGPLENLSGNFQTSANAGITRKDKVGNTEAKFEYRFYRALIAGVFARYEARDSNVLADQGADGNPYPVFDYNATSVGFQVKFGWE